MSAVLLTGAAASALLALGCILALLPIAAEQRKRTEEAQR